MRGINRKRALLISSAVILLCTSIIAGTTFALFTDKRTVVNHLSGGDMQVTLSRVALEKHFLNIAGFIETKTVQTETDKLVDFTEASAENVFGFDEGEIVVPGSKYVATMKVSNIAETSDVAFGYWIEIQCASAEAAKELAKQISVTVETADGKKYVNPVGAGLKIGSQEEVIGVLDLKDHTSETFTVTIEFLDSFKDDNDLEYFQNDKVKRGDELTFDLLVHAVQITTAPTPQE